MTPAKAQTELAKNIKTRRLGMGLTQASLSKRSGVALATLRKFEQTGAVSVENLFKLMLVVGGLERLIDASAPEQEKFASMDDVLSGVSKPPRKRGKR